MAEIKYLRLSHCQWINRLSKQIIDLTKAGEAQDVFIQNLLDRVNILEKEVDDNSILYSGETDPEESLGKIGDSYLELGNGSLWKKEVSGWVQQGYISVCGEEFSE